MILVQTLMSTAQVAETLDLSTERVRQLARSGRLACIVTPYGRLFDSSMVNALALTRARKARRQKREAAADGSA